MNRPAAPPDVVRPAASPGARIPAPAPTPKALAVALVAVVAAGLIAALGPRPCLAQGGAPARIVAEVNGVPITEQELDYHLALDEEWLQLVHERGSAAARERPKLERKVLDRLIDQILYVQEAEARGLGLSPEEEREIERMFEENARASRGSKEALDAYLQERGIPIEIPFQRFRSSFLARKVLQLELQGLDTFIKPSEIREYYRRYQRRYETPPRIVYRYIWIERPEGAEDDARARIEACFEKLRAGADWNDCCKAYSEGVAVDEGGRQEERSLESVTPLLRDALAALEPGAMSGVIAIPPRRDNMRVRPGAFAIVRLDERTAGGVKPLSTVEEDIRRLLRELRQDEVREELQKRLRERASIRIRL